ncbi:MAG TPA: ABC transporter permease, partial [Vicinamibacterales bacterium]|nr:ABC transporter permease [Vicinamibacterales bacterium]
TVSVDSATELAGPAASIRARLRLSVLREYAIIISFAALFITLSVASEPFLTRTNLLNVLDQTCAFGIIAAGETVVFIAGGFDLSVGAVFGLSGVVAAMLAPHIGAGGALTIGLLSGLAAGVCNGLLVTIGRINAFMATIGSGFVIAGLALVLTKGYLISVTNPSYSILGQGQWHGVTYGIWSWLVVALLLTALLRFTAFGRYVFASGGNPIAARLSGLRVDAIRTAAFALSGLTAALGGIILSSRVQTGQADAGNNIELTVIAAVVIGGTSIFGGEGAIWRSALGVLLLTLIGNGFNLMNVNPIYQQILQGTIILLAVGLDAWSRTANR